MTKESHPKTLEAGVGLPEAAFLHLWDAAGAATEEEEPEAGPSYSSSDEEAGEISLGYALDHMGNILGRSVHALHAL